MAPSSSSKRDTMSRGFSFWSSAPRETTSQSSNSYPVDLVHSYAAPSPLPDVALDSRTSSTKSRREPPPPLDLQTVNKSQPLPDNKADDKGQAVDSIETAKSTTKSDYSDGTIDQEVKPENARLAPTSNRQPASATESGAQGVIGILRDAGRRSSQWMTGPTPSRSGIRIVEPAVPNRYRSFGTPAVPAGFSGPAWDKPECAIEEPGGAEDGRPPCKPCWTWKCKLISIFIALAIIGGIVAGVVVGVAGKSKDKDPVVTLPQATLDSASTLKECLSLYQSASRTAPTTYPCNACVGLLRAAGNDLDPGAKAAGGTGAALQFCALMDIFETVPNQEACFAVGWGAGVNPCNGKWKGIGCQEGRVINLDIVNPCLPATLPDSLGDIVGLKSLRVVGDKLSAGDNADVKTLPSGPVPKTLHNLPHLAKLDLEYTSLTTLSNIRFVDMSQLKGLILMNNPGLGNVMPDFSGLGLTMLTLTHQDLTVDSFKNASAESTSLKHVSFALENNLPNTLTYLDLSYNNFTGRIPAFLTHKLLETLSLENNNFSVLPTQLPGTLKDLRLAGNRDLTGSMYQLCELANWVVCDMEETSLERPVNEETGVIPGPCHICSFPE